RAARPPESATSSSTPPAHPDTGPHTPAAPSAAVPSHRSGREPKRAPVRSRSPPATNTDPPPHRRFPPPKPNPPPPRIEEIVESPSAQPITKPHPRTHISPHPASRPQPQSFSLSSTFSSTS